MKIFLILLVVATSVFVLSITPVLASNWLHSINVNEGTLIPAACTDSVQKTKCGLNEVFQTIINFTQILLALTGSVMILMFVYGGTLMIIGGAGNSDNITKGKEAIKAAVIGLVIILGAWLAVNFTILALTKGDVGGAATIFNGRPFNEKPIGEVKKFNLNDSRNFIDVGGGNVMTP